MVTTPPKNKRAVRPGSGDTLTWLHLSDFHFRSARDWQLDVVLKALVRSVLEKLPDEGLQPDLVLVSGDIAFSGRAEEYQVAQAFFKEANRALKLRPSTRWFIAPGNHDVDRSRIDPTAWAVKLDDLEALNRAMSAPSFPVLFSSRQEAFFDFTRAFLGRSRGWKTASPWEVKGVTVGGRKVAVLCLNTAWAAGRNGERAQLLLGEYQVREALAAADRLKPALKIALYHHPLSHMREFDEEKVSSLLTSPGGVHFLLRGHLHEGKLTGRLSPDGFGMEVAAGACWQHSTFPHGVNVVQMDFGAREARIHLWRYSPHGRGFWARDNFLYENAPGGLWTFGFPGSWRF